MALTEDLIKNINIFNGSGPALKAITITPSDTNYLADANDAPIHTRGIMVTVAGNLDLVFANQIIDENVTVPVSANVLYPFAVKMVLEASTATGIIGFF
jgi:hypothetical protein